MYVFSLVLNKVNLYFIYENSIKEIILSSSYNDHVYFLSFSQLKENIYIYIYKSLT